jgi:GR25 family glycosyltransferase involved in LPS biosynthesis
MKIDLRDIQTFYINMDKHVDRNKDMIQLGKDLELKNYERLPGTEIVGHPKAGCATSHLEILSSISKPTIILEDDCVIASGSVTIDVPDDADAIYLGLSEWGYLNSISKRKNFNHKRHSVFKSENKID